VGRAVGDDFVEMILAEGERSLEIGDELGRDRVLAGRPDGENGGEVGEAAPGFDDVVDMEIDRARQTGSGACADLFYFVATAGLLFDGYGETQGRIADEEGGVEVAQHGGEVGLGFSERWGDFPVVGAENFGEGLGAAGAGVQGHGLRLLNWTFGDQQKAADSVFRGDGEVGENGEVVDALVFDGRDDGDVGLFGAEGFGAQRGDGKREVVFALQRAVSEPANQRRGVEVLNDGDAELWQVGCSSAGNPSIADQILGRATTLLL
jgi:hypothetical protein